MIVTLPFPVSANQLYNGGSGQQRFPSKKYKAWVASCPWLPPKRLGKVVLTYRYYFPDMRARDTQNYEKCVTDMLVKQQVIVDDTWQNIKQLTLIPMGVDKKNPRVEITIEV